MLAQLWYIFYAILRIMVTVNYLTERHQYSYSTELEMVAAIKKPRVRKSRRRSSVTALSVLACDRPSPASSLNTCTFIWHTLFNIIAGEFLCGNIETRIEQIFHLFAMIHRWLPVCISCCSNNNIGIYSLKTSAPFKGPCLFGSRTRMVMVPHTRIAQISCKKQKPHY